MASIPIGASCLFWLDLWNGQILQQAFPELFSYAKSINISVQRMKNVALLNTYFHLPLSTEAYDQFIQLEDIIQNLQLIEFRAWSMELFMGFNYVLIAYGKNITSTSGTLLAVEIILSERNKILFWLVLKDRLSARELLRCKNMFLDDYNCVLCSHGVEESLFHLLFHCPFAMACWNTLNLPIPVGVTPFQISSSCLSLWTLWLPCAGPSGQSRMICSSEAYQPQCNVPRWFLEQNLP